MGSFSLKTIPEENNVFYLYMLLFIFAEIWFSILHTFQYCTHKQTQNAITRYNVNYLKRKYVLYYYYRHQGIIRPYDVHIKCSYKLLLQCLFYHKDFYCKEDKRDKSFENVAFKIVRFVSAFPNTVLFH